MLNKRYAVVNGSLHQRTSGGAPTAIARGTREMASFFPANTASVPTSMMPSGSSFNSSKLLTGITPETEETLLPYYRDMYYYDAIAGATVDIIGSFPFSDFALIGLEKEQLDVFNDTVARLNIRSLMTELSHGYLVDGAFIGSLVYDPANKTFQDVLIHDRMNAQITARPFFALDPAIRVNSSAQLQQFLGSGSPYTESVLGTYPRDFVDMFMRGPVDLDPLTTVYIARKTLVDQPTTSYLKRLLPMYLLERTLFRGTLVEAMKRMRATSLVQVGTDTWEPTIAEMQTVLAQLQMAEMDQLGAWVVTRQGVNVQDIRQAGDMWKWTDLIDTLVPYKLRALGISEAFLSGDASYSTAETAVAVFTENMATYREQITHRLFRDKLFPLIAVANGRYIDRAKADERRTPEAVLRNMSNSRNLQIPELRWRKNLDNHDPSVMDALEKLGDHGVPVPLKMWAAAANVDLGMLLGNLEEDAGIRERIETITGTKPTDAGGLSEDEDGGEYARTLRTAANLRRVGIRSANSPAGSPRVGLLQRDYGNAADAYDARTSKSGNKVHATLGGRRMEAQRNDNILKAVRALRDPQHRHNVRSRIIERCGRMPQLI